MKSSTRQASAPPKLCENYTQCTYIICTLDVSTDFHSKQSPHFKTWIWKRLTWNLWLEWSLTFHFTWRYSAAAILHQLMATTCFYSDKQFASPYLNALLCHRHLQSSNLVVSPQTFVTLDNPGKQIRSSYWHANTRVHLGELESLTNDH